MFLIRKWLYPVAALLLIAGLADQAEARNKRVSQIPNGGILGCAICHVDPNGGGPRNPFGQIVEQSFLTGEGWQGDVVWGPELAAADTDGDGATNGDELGDPDGTWDWQSGEASPGDPNAVTNPGDPESLPVATAVESSTWAMVKILIQQPWE